MTEDEVLVEETTEEAAQEPITVETLTTEEEGVTVNVTISQPVQSDVSADETVEEDEAAVEETAEETSTVVRTISVVSADAQSDDASSTMADAVTAVLGEYQGKTYTVQEVDADGNVIATSTEYVPGLAGLDYAWIAGAILFGLFIAGCFKLLGGLMRS